MYIIEPDEKAVKQTHAITTKEKEEDDELNNSTEISVNASYLFGFLLPLGGQGTEVAQSRVEISSTLPQNLNKERQEKYQDLAGNMSVQWSASRLCEYLNVDHCRCRCRRHLLVYVYGGAQSNKPNRTKQLEKMYVLKRVVQVHGVNKKYQPMIG